MIFKTTFKSTNGGGQHVVCRMFVTPSPDQAWANMGTLIVRADEFDALRAAMSGFTFEPEGST